MADIRKRSALRNVTIVCLLLIGVTSCAGLSWWASLMWRGTPHFIPLVEVTFESDAWRRGDQVVRGTMVADLQRSGCLIGMSKPDVIALLGEPDGNHGDAMSYTVDIGHRFFDSVWWYSLFIELDRVVGTVKRAEVMD